MPEPLISVVIAARNAAGTIGRAVRSALREPEVAEVVLVDDASSDRTVAAARDAAEGDRRLSVIQLDINRGPAAARNLAINRSSAPFVAVLDADDRFLERRFRNVFSVGGWDFAADDIIFVEEGVDPPVAVGNSEAKDVPQWLSLKDFVEGNISRRGTYRGELGFLKPVIKRSFIERHGLLYNERLRLGEDYEFYARALIHGARFKVTSACGYLATVRPNSISGCHRTDDLLRLANADRAMLQMEGLPDGAAAALKRHERQVRDKYRLRRFLDRKAEAGVISALAFAFSGAGNPLTIARGIATDKARAFRKRVVPDFAKSDQPPVRFLMRSRVASGDGFSRKG